MRLQSGLPSTPAAPTEHAGALHGGLQGFISAHFSPTVASSAQQEAFLEKPNIFQWGVFLSA